MVNNNKKCRDDELAEKTENLKEIIKIKNDQKCEKISADTMFVIEQAWSDSMENTHASAFGYSVLAVTNDEEIARQFCTDGGVVTKKTHGWAAPEGNPIFKYTEALILYKEECKDE